MSLTRDVSGQIIGCHGTDKMIEVFYFCSDDEAQVRLKKRVKKEQKNLQKYFNPQHPTILTTKHILICTG